MASQEFSVTDIKADDGHVPDGAAEYVMFMRVLRARGWLEGITGCLRVARQGGHAWPDVFAFVLAMLTWPLAGGRRRTCSGFAAATSWCGARLAAVAGRGSWPGQSAISRFMGVVPVGQPLREAGARMLALGVDPLLRHPDAATLDTCGRAWQVFHFDPVVVALRQRGLPVGGDLPPPVRRLDAIAAPGHSGRKRGEVQVSMGLMQHAGTSVFVQVELAPGNADMAAMLAAQLPAVLDRVDAAGSPRALSAVVFDGAGGNLPTLQVFGDSGIHYLTRLHCYGVLVQPGVAAQLAEARWVMVPDSGSGPRRQTTELGVWQRHTDDGAPEGLHRMVVTRYRAEAKHGAGKLLDGWHYEIFGTSMDASAWPAPELVALYLGRAAQENRFAQVMDQLGLDRLFCHRPGGQWLIVLVGLMLWNLRTVLGAERAGPLQAPTGAPRERVEEPAPPEPAAAPVVDEAARAPADIVDAAPGGAGDGGQARRLLGKLDTLEWSRSLRNQAGWRWERGVGLRCPDGRLVLPVRLRIRVERHSHELYFRARQSDCGACPRRNGCFGGRVNRRDQRGLAVGVRSLDLDPYDTQEAIRQLRQAGKSGPGAPVPSSHRLQAPAPVAPGPWEVRGPCLLPAVLRSAWSDALEGVRVHVQVTHAPPAPPPQTWRASLPARRQRRRLTWTEREARNALPDSSSVRTHVQVRDPWLRKVTA